MFRISRFENKAIQSLIDAGLPVFDGEETTQVSSSINLDDLLTNTRQYFTYTGSLTTPPCSEGVTWIILKRRAPISSVQYEEFRKILGNNFRPIQDINNRVVRTTVKRRPRW
jgi:carbonic anhydrase